MRPEVNQPPVGSSWRGVLILVVFGLVVGLGPAGILIGLGLIAIVLERTAPHELDRLIDVLTF
jgi:hypothetical protein